MKVPVSSKRPRIEIIPLIDTVFLLLVFFIYAMLSMVVHRGLPVLLPNSSTAEIEKELIISVTVLSDGSIHLDKERISLDRLGEGLRKKAGGREGAGVLLFAHRDLSYQRLIRVLDEIRRAGLTRISLQAEAD